MNDDKSEKRLTPDSSVSDKLMYSWVCFNRIDGLAVRGLPDAGEELKAYEKETLAYDSDKLYNLLIQHRIYYSNFLLEAKKREARPKMKKRKLVSCIRMAWNLLEEILDLAETEIRMEFLHAISYVVRNQFAMYMTLIFLYNEEKELVAECGRECMDHSEEVPPVFLRGCDGILLTVSIYAAEDLIYLEQFEEAEKMRKSYLDGYYETRSRILRTQPYMDTRFSMVESLSVIYYVLTSIYHPEENEKRVKYFEKISKDKRLLVTKIVSNYI